MTNYYADAVAEQLGRRDREPFARRKGKLLFDQSAPGRRSTEEILVGFCDQQREQERRDKYQQKFAVKGRPRVGVIRRNRGSI